MNYMNRVFEILEDLDYPELVLSFEPECVARTVAQTIVLCQVANLSERMCAILIWSLTMTEQVLPNAQRAVKH